RKPCALQRATASPISSGGYPLVSSLRQSCASVRRRSASIASAADRAGLVVVVRRGDGTDGVRNAVGRVGRLQRLADLRRELVGDVAVFLEERLGVLAALADALLAVRVPRA